MKEDCDYVVDYELLMRFLDRKTSSSGDHSPSGVELDIVDGDRICLVSLTKEAVRAIGRIRLVFTQPGASTGIARLKRSQEVYRHIELWGRVGHPRDEAICDVLREEGLSRNLNWALTLSPHTSERRERMSWQPWFNGPNIPLDRMIFALREDHSGVDLLYQEYRGHGKDLYSVWCFGNGDDVPDQTQYCAWMPAPAETPKYPGREKEKLKAVK